MKFLRPCCEGRQVSRRAGSDSDIYAPVEFNRPIIAKSNPVRQGGMGGWFREGVLYEREGSEPGLQGHKPRRKGSALYMNGRKKKKKATRNMTLSVSIAFML